jgi:hypothetical protein
MTPFRRVLGGIVVLGAAIGPALPAAAATGATETSTIPIAVLSITISPATSTFGTCSQGNSTPTGLGFPNGSCFAPGDLTGITITNTGPAGHIFVQGGDAVPSDGGTHWTLTGSTPGRDQYLLSTAGVPGNNGGVLLTTSPQCDQAVTGTTCAAGAGASFKEQLDLVGPSVSTDPSPSFSTQVTWTVAL